MLSHMLNSGTSRLGKVLLLQPSAQVLVTFHRRQSQLVLVCGLVDLLVTGKSLAPKTLRSS